MEGLREVAKELNFTPDPKAQGWNTQRYGSAIVKFAQTGEMPNMSTHSKIEESLSYQRTEKEEETENNGLDSKTLEDEYILFTSKRDGVTIKSQEETEAFLLKEGENRAYLKKYPFLKDGFSIDELDGLDISDIDFSHVSKLKVKSLNGMFRGLQLDKLDLTHLDTSGVKEANEAFTASQIGIIDMSGLDFSKLEDPKYCGMFFNFPFISIDTILLNGCNSKTIKNIKAALERKVEGVNIIADSTPSESSVVSSEYANITDEMLEELKTSDNIIVVMKKSDVKNIDELFNELDGGDNAAVITRVGEDFHYICDNWDGMWYLKERENDINFDELYFIYDFPQPIEMLDTHNLEEGVYLCESASSYFDSDSYPDDDNGPAYVVAEALTGDDTGHVWSGVSFNPHKIFICDGKIVTECD